MLAPTETCLHGRTERTALGRRPFQQQPPHALRRLTEADGAGESDNRGYGRNQRPQEKKEVLDEQLNRIFVPEDPARSLVRGCTTNPPLSLTAVKKDPKYWNEWIDDLIASNSGLELDEYFWITYKEVIRRGAEMMLPIWEASGMLFLCIC